MKSEYQQLREILDAVRYPVDPRHESDFRAILLGDRKRGRRNVLWFFLCCAGMLTAGYGIVSSLRDFPAKRFFGTEPAEESSVFRSATSQENVTLPIGKDTELSDMPVGAAENTTGGSQPEVSEESEDLTAFTSNSANSINSTNSTYSANSTNAKETTAIPVTKSGKNNTQSAQKLRNSSIQADAVTTGVNQSTSQANQSASNPLEPTPASEQISISDNTEDGQSLHVVQIENQKRIHPGHDEALLNTSVSDPSIHNPKVAEKTPIIPSERRIHFNKVHYGLSAAWFPVGSLLKKSTLRTGYGYQIGGYATYRVTPRTLLRADAGFSRLNGGFTYIKQSSSQQFGFSVVNKNHTLDIEKLYTAYASGEIGLKRGKNVFSVGVLGQYLYGARGNIESTVQGQTETPVVTVSNDVWVSTKDINNFSLQGTASVRAHLTRRLQVAAMVRIPITNTVRIPGDNPLYEFQVKSHGISPQLSMSYQINQQ